MKALLRHLFHPWFGPRRSLPRPRLRLGLEALEERSVPAVYYWIGPPGGADWNTGAYWQNPITHTTGTVPGAGDYATFGDPGTDGPCTVSGTVTVDRVTMTGQYAGTLTVGPGASLAATSLFHQNGTLALEGGAVASNNNFYVYGTVTATPDGAGTSSTLTAGAGLWLQGPSLTVLGGTAAAPGLLLASPSISTSDEIFVGDGGGAAGALGIAGSLTVGLTSAVNVYQGSFVGFTAAGPASTFTVMGNLNLHGATIATDTALQLAVGGGTLNSLAGAGNLDVIDGDVNDLGTVNVGSASGGVSALQVSEALTVASAGELALYESCNLSVAGGLAGVPLLLEGRVDLYGATLTSYVEVWLNGGTLVTHGGASGAADTINAGPGFTALNAGSIQFVGLLHTLQLSGEYNQAAQGSLGMRVAADGSNDRLEVGGMAALGGTITVTLLGTPTLGTTWDLITTTGGIVPGTFFATRNLPSGFTDSIIGGIYTVAF